MVDSGYIMCMIKTSGAAGPLFIFSGTIISGDDIVPRRAPAGHTSDPGRNN